MRVAFQAVATLLKSIIRASYGARKNRCFSRESYAVVVSPLHLPLLRSLCHDLRAICLGEEPHSCFPSLLLLAISHPLRGSPYVRTASRLLSRTALVWRA